MIYFGIEDSRLLKQIGEYQGVYPDRKYVIETGEQITIPLRVIRSNGFDISPDTNIVVTDLNRGTDGIIYKKFYNKGYGGTKFKIQVLIKVNETWESDLYQQYKNLESNQHLLRDVLHELIVKMIPVKVVTDAVDIPNQNYIITGNSSRKQGYEDYTVWELEFTTYVPLTETVFKNDNTVVKKAINSAKAKQVKKKTTSSKKSSAKKSALSKCKREVLVYSKKKKVVECVKTLQKILKQKSCYTGVVDGWFGKLTTEAVKKYQKKKKFKKNIQTGKVNKTTYNALCKE